MSDGPHWPSFAPYPSTVPAPIVDLRPIADVLSFHGQLTLPTRRTLEAAISRATSNPEFLPRYVAGILLDISTDRCRAELQRFVRNAPDWEGRPRIDYVLAIARQYGSNLPPPQMSSPPNDVSQEQIEAAKAAHLSAWHDVVRERILMLEKSLKQ